MKTKHLLWQILGPLIAAVLLLAVFFSIPFHYQPVSQHELLKASVSLDTATFKNRFLKKRALTDKKIDFVPIFGSSELERMDKFHPAIMAAKYHTYRPFLFGKRGAQSLPQFMAMETILPQLKNRKIVFIISPQWFVKSGISPAAFKYYNGQLADLTWLKNADPNSSYDRYLAQRLTQLLDPASETAQLAQRIAAKKQLTAPELKLIAMQRRLLLHEDAFFSRFRPNDNYSNRITWRLNRLPNKYNYQKLKLAAQSDGKSQSNNNHFRIFNGFYTQRIKAHYQQLSGAEKNFSYLKSPEYADLELVLRLLAQEHTQVLFVIQPVNTKWAHYTKLSLPMYYRAVQKIKFQLQQQGFDQIADYSHQGSVPYFMQDTIHIGWLGWVVFDHRMNEFVHSKPLKTHYQLQKKFLSKTWQNLNPNTANLQHFAVMKTKF